MLGFASRWVAAVASHVESIDVITMQRGRVDLPANVRVHSCGKERGLSEPRRAAEFARILAAILRRGRPDACFSHMVPVFSVMAAPVLVPLGVPIVTWYAHPKVTPTLRAAHLVSARMVSCAPDSYRYRPGKLTVLGHGIDTDLFSPEGGPRPPAGATLRVVSVGRISPVKDPVTIVDAIAQLRHEGVDARLDLVGAPPPAHRAYAEGLRRHIALRGLSDAVTLVGPVPNAEAPERHRAAHAHVNAAPADHSLDKAVLEAMACERPSITSVGGFAPTMGRFAERLIFPAGRSDELAARLRWLWDAGAEERARIGADLRGRVTRMHGLDRLAPRLVAELAAARGAR